jgi:hypothetical protein
MAARAEGTRAEGKGKEEKEEWGPPQSNTMIRYLTTQTNPEVSELNQEKTPTGDG